MLTTLSTNEIKETAAKSLKMANQFYKVWESTKDIASGRMAISAYNTVLKANQLLVAEGRITKKPTQVRRNALRKTAQVKKKITKKKK